MRGGSRPGERRGGRKKGTPNKATADIKAAAQEYTCEALEKLAEIMRASDSDAARVSAIKEILDRGHGRSRQAVEVEANVTASVTRIELIGVRPGDDGPG